MEKLHSVDASYLRDMKDALCVYGASGLIQQLAAYNHDYYYMMGDIQHGPGCAERDPYEDPAEVLKELRENYRLTADKEADRAYLLKVLADLITAADWLTKGLSL